MADDRKIKVGGFYYHMFFGREETLCVTNEKNGHFEYVLLRDPTVHRWVPYSLIKNVWIEYENNEI